MKRKTRLYELVTYTVIWVLLFAAPVMTEFVHSVYDNGHAAIEWHIVWHVWRSYVPFLVAFVLHDCLLAPRLICRHQRTLYAGCMTAICACFVIYQCSFHPDRRPHHQAPRVSETGPRHEPRCGNEDHDFIPFDDDGTPDAQRPPRRPAPHMFSKGDDHMPRPLFGEHEVIAVIILTLMFGMNLGMKNYVIQRDHEADMAEREHRNLEQQLEYLKYQINPHFLMNTLNNIHALIDIDSAEAQHTIVDLSHLLRFVLYDGAKPLVPLTSELKFISDYIALMRQRLSDKVDISFTTPDITSTDIQVPPLLFITFVENAFKHGVSYRKHSFIHIAIAIDGQHVTFTCHNSRQTESESCATHHGGVGLENARERLELLFHGRYTLDITPTTTDYSVRLSFPYTVDVA